MTKAAIAAGKVPEGEPALISIIDGSAGATDLLTLRVVKRLQDADVIFCDPGTNSDILELARRDAARVHLNSNSRFPNATAASIQAQMVPGQNAVWIANEANFRQGGSVFNDTHGVQIEVLGYGISHDDASVDLAPNHTEVAGP